MLKRSKRIAWTLLKIPKPDGSRTLQRYLNQGLNYFDVFVPIRGKYALEIGGEEIKNLDRRPSTSELQQAWKIAAADVIAEQEVEEIEKKITEFRAEEEKSLADARDQEAARVATLLEMTADKVPSLKETSKENANEKERARVPNIFTECEISQVLQSIPALPNEDAFLAELGQATDKQLVTVHMSHTENTAKCQTSPFLQQLEAIERVAQRRGQRVNKLLHDAATAKADYTCVGPDETIPCLVNTLAYFQVQLDKAAEVKKEAQEESPTDEVLREGVARAVARIASRKLLKSTLARFGLGVVCDGQYVVFVRVELDDRTVPVCSTMPVYVSKVLPIAEGLCYLARMMCCSLAEQFGLCVGNMLELLPSSYQYARALGSGFFADVVAVRDIRAEAEQSELACKVAHRGAVYSCVLAYEAHILGKLQTIATGVPKFLHYYCDGEPQEDWGETRESIADSHGFHKKRSLLLTSPVGTPLLEHMKSLRGEGERRSFARRVWEELKPVLSAVHAKGIVHGDIRPNNIVVVGNGAMDRDVNVFLIDWGCATEQEKKVPWWTKRVRNPFVSDRLLFTQECFPQDDEQSLLLTCVAIRESPTARPPWPFDNLDHRYQFMRTRTRWLREYANNHPELDLTPLRLDG